MRRRLAGPGITDFHDDVDCFECFGKLAFGLGNVSGIPLDYGAIVTVVGERSEFCDLL
jgi:hypothetical protein